MPRPRSILSLLVACGIMLSLAGLGVPMACAGNATAKTVVAETHSCCHTKDVPKTPAGSGGSDCGSKCLMQCCRLMMPADVPLNRTGVAPAIAGALPASDFASDLTNPDPLFHPPRSC